MTASPTTPTIKPTTTTSPSQPQKKCTTCTNQSCKSLARRPTTTTTSLPTMAYAAATSATSTSTAASKPLLTPLQKFASVFREAHPIGRVPAYLRPHDRPAMLHYLRRMGRTGKLFVPLMVAFCKSRPLPPPFFRNMSCHGKCH
jgi:hypothetical protein